MNNQSNFAVATLAAILAFSCVSPVGAQELSGDEFTCVTVEQCQEASRKIARDIADEVGDDNSPVDGSQPLSTTGL